MGRVLYDGNRVIPAPFVSIQKRYDRTDDGEKIGSVFSIQLSNDLVAFAGSPASDQSLWTAGGYPADEDIGASARLGSIIRKQEALRELFSEDGKTLEIQSNDGSQPMKCNPIVVDIQFQDGPWFNVCKYTISLEASTITVNGIPISEDSFPEYISSATESWDFATDESTPESVELNRTYTLTHSLSAKGKRYYDENGILVKPAWQWARDWVITRLGFDSTIALSSGINNLPTYYGGYNHVRSNQLDENGGSFSATEAWILSSGSSLEDFNVQISTSNEDGKTSVSVDGVIRGLDERNGNFNIIRSKINNAEARWSGVQSVLLTRAQAYSGKTLNIIPLNTTIGKNPAQGTINYNFSYDNRPSNVITDSKSEVITVNDNFDIDAIAVIGILGRTAGPVIQFLNSHKENTRSLNIEVVFDPEIFNSGSITNRFVNNHPVVREPTKTEIQEIVNAVNPINAGLLNNAGVPASIKALVEQGTTWDGSRFGLNITWVWE